MRRTVSAGNLEFDPEIERTARILRREAKLRKEKSKMADEDREVAVIDETSI